MILNQNWYHPPTHPTQQIWYFWSKKSQIPCLFFIPRKHAVADPTVLRSTRPTCPRWRPPQRRARWAPLSGRCSPPLSSYQVRCAEMTSCCSSSSADHRPPEHVAVDGLTKQSKTKRRSVWGGEWGEIKRKGSKGWRQHGERRRSVYQSVNEIRMYLFTSSKKEDPCKTLFDPFPWGT